MFAATGAKPQTPAVQVRAPSQVPAAGSAQSISACTAAVSGLVWRLRQVPPQQVRPVWQSFAPVVSQASPGPPRDVHMPPMQTVTGGAADPAADVGQVQQTSS